MNTIKEDVSINKFDYEQELKESFKRSLLSNKNYNH